MSELERLLDGLAPGWRRQLQAVLGAKIDSERNHSLRDDIVQRFLSQLLTDDERAKLLGLPSTCRVRENTKLLMPERLRCGEYVWIGENAYLDASGGLEIGDHTTIGVGVFVWTHTSVLANILAANEPGGSHVIRRRVKIGSRCYIVGPSVINPGVTIGDGALVLPLSVVTRDVPPHVIVAGAPAEVKSSVDSAFVERLRIELQSQVSPAKEGLKK
jgi:acetyltransferase-like isoleucine patch superfamily enzyme